MSGQQVSNGLSRVHLVRYFSSPAEIKRSHAVGRSVFLSSASAYQTRAFCACNRHFSLLAQRQLPLEGWSSLEVKQLLLELAAADANCQHGQAAVGEREGRVYSSLVRERHFHFSHGIGR